MNNFECVKLEVFIKEMIKLKPGLQHEFGTNTLCCECQNDTGIEPISTPASSVYMKLWTS